MTAVNTILPISKETAAKLPDRVRDMTWLTGTRKVSNIGCE